MKLDSIKVFCHNSICINGSKKIYIDPFKIKENFNDADYIFCTHSHYDHYSEQDILKVLKDDTKIIVTQDILDKAIELLDDESRVFGVVPDNEYCIGELKFKTTYAYNLSKPFHPKQNKWVGYIIEQDDIKYYIAGDTDNIPEMKDVMCDVAFLPVGGKYTMDVEEAVNATNIINAKCFIPTHYGLIIGDINDGKRFANLANKEVNVMIK